VEKLRGRIEADLKATYDKLCRSSLDKDYPGTLLKRIGASASENSQLIAKTVNQMFVDRMKEDREAWERKTEMLGSCGLQQDPQRREDEEEPQQYSRHAGRQRRISELERAAETESMNLGLRARLWPHNVPA
jgi:hypothetical protein